MIPDDTIVNNESMRVVTELGNTHANNISIKKPINTNYSNFEFNSIEDDQ
jgi:hypothetical protein